MNYEQKYKEALERARHYYKANLKFLADIFPELQEPEDDERICIAILSCLNYLAEQEDFEKVGGVTISEMTDWIKREQCESLL